MELLQKTELTTHQQQYLNYMSTSAQNLLSVLNDILTYSKLEARNVTLESKPFSLRQCM